MIKRRRKQIRYFIQHLKTGQEKENMNYSLWPILRKHDPESLCIKKNIFKIWKIRQT